MFPHKANVGFKLVNKLMCSFKTITSSNLLIAKWKLYSHASGKYGKLWKVFYISSLNFWY